MNLKGYIAPSGNYITIAEQKARNSKFKKVMKEYREEQAEEMKRQDQIAIAGMIERRREKQEAIEQEQIFIAQCKQFISYAAETMQYKEYLIAWDIANSDSLQIEADVLNNKITLEQVKKVFTLAQNYINNLTDKIYMNDLLAI